MGKIVCHPLTEPGDGPAGRAASPGGRRVGKLEVATGALAPDVREMSSETRSRRVAVTPRSAGPIAYEVPRVLVRPRRWCSRALQRAQTRPCHLRPSAAWQPSLCSIKALSSRIPVPRPAPVQVMRRCAASTIQSPITLLCRCAASVRCPIRGTPVRGFLLIRDPMGVGG